MSTSTSTYYNKITISPIINGISYVLTYTLKYSSDYTYELSDESTSNNFIILVYDSDSNLYATITINIDVDNSSNIESEISISGSTIKLTFDVDEPYDITILISSIDVDLEYTSSWIVSDVLGFATSYDTFAEDSDYVAQAITQKLSIIRDELWYNRKKGIPLGSVQKVIDTYIIRTILSIDGVNSITRYISTRSGNKLSISVIVLYNNSPLIINV